MSFFTRSVSPQEKEKRIESVLAMFPLLSRDHFLYSTMDRYNWDLNQAVDALRRRSDYLEQEQRNIERRLEENRLKREKEQREVMLIGKLRDIFGNQFSHDQYSRALNNHRMILEDAVNYFMGEIEREQRREENNRRQRIEEEERRIRAREREEQLRIERNKDKMNNLLLELKYSTEEQKREIYNSRLFKDMVRDFKDLMEPHLPPQSQFTQPSQSPYYAPIQTQPPVHSFDPFPIKSNPTNPFAVLPQTTPLVPITPNNNLPVSAFLFKELKAMFPSTPDAQINAVLQSSDGNITVAIQALLDLNLKN